MIDIFCKGMEKLPLIGKSRRANNQAHQCASKGYRKEPFEGIGKPEALKHALSGYWSRRINDEHRIVYKIHEESILIAQLRYHY